MIDFEYEEKHFAYKLFNAFPITKRNLRKLALISLSSTVNHVIKNYNEIFK